MRGDRRRTAARQLTNRRNVQCDGRAPDALTSRHGLAFKTRDPAPIRSELAYLAGLYPRAVKTPENQLFAFSASGWLSTRPSGLENEC